MTRWTHLVQGGLTADDVVVNTGVIASLRTAMAEQLVGTACGMPSDQLPGVDAAGAAG